MADLTLKELKSRLHYDPLTGVFTRIKSYHKRWEGTVAGSKDKDGYVVLKINEDAHKAHRLAWYYTYGEWPSGEIDHINGVRDDNRIENLRDVDKRSNMQNTKYHRHGSLPGVHQPKGTPRYQAKIIYGSSNYHLGMYDTPEEAHAVYMKACDNGLEWVKSFRESKGWKNG